jgi:uncharacterized protein (TIGR02453 family)
MKRINKETLAFLSGLKKNNDREWFSKNRPSYEMAKENFELFIQAIIDELIKAEPILKGLEAKSCIFRINRDTRFSNDKSPYKTNFGAFIVKGGRKNGDRYPGYYIHIEPGECMIAGGSYMPPTQWLASIREKISDDPASFKKIIGSAGFVKFFGSVEGEKLKKAPKGFSPDSPDIDLIKFKSYLAVHNISDTKIVSEDFLSYALEVINAMRPFNEYLYFSE